MNRLPYDFGCVQKTQRGRLNNCCLWLE